MKKKIESIYIRFDYGILLPFFGIFPYKLGRFFAKCRGALYFYFQRDWRSFTFGDTELFKRTLNSYKIIIPNLNNKEYTKLTRQRYIYQSVEEYEAVLLSQGKFPLAEVVYEGEKEVFEYIQKNPHCVFITGHFGNSLAGVCFLEFLGIPILGMSSSVTKNSNVHPSITKLYNEKYKAIAKRLNGGDVIDIEGNAKKFMDFLKKTGSLIIIADLPPASVNEVPLFKDFFGKKRGFASGASKLSKSVNGKIIPFVSYYENGKYIMKFGDLKNDPYNFLENEIQKRPYLWWACDLLEEYKIKEGTVNEI